ncbi:putative sulfate exporter family transporter [Cognatiyoonia sp. IB215446]|uniref:YeiH family protein n=1 Tax=Cognatiyoonia sp. IB215446 TaxID=3097355 RepID=UPI002A175258|nr:putative sulfate exporter family transporter [Cognatiyoonia sp. IB215446]MDX8347455.1 putative sulfate exporter family transporter [Cognatiyoonia sp. IB215446]
MIASLNPAALSARSKVLFPGVVVAGLTAIAAQWLAEHYATPAMLLALLLGIALSFLGEEGKTVEGVGFAARTLLRLGIAFLGARISMELTAQLGLPLVLLIIGAVAATIAFGLLIGRFFGSKWRFSFLTAGSVAICGASAALAIAAILPKDERSEQRLLFTVMGVTVLSTIAMIVYPIIVNLLSLNDLAAGVFLGGTIHDVAQVVGAGFSVSENVGDTATLVKLIRVSLLAPVVIIAALLIRSFATPDESGERPPIIPAFVVGFLLLATLNSLGWIPGTIAGLLSEASRWLLLTAIAAVGMKTNLKKVLAVGGSAIALIVTQTIFIASIILSGVYFLT